jgi:hypothetical protein
VTTSELHVVDLETGTARDLGRIGTEARSPVWWQAGGCWHLAYLAMPNRSAATPSTMSPSPRLPLCIVT